MRGPTYIGIKPKKSSPVKSAHHRFNVKLVVLRVAWAAPRRTEKDNVRPYARRELHVVTKNELYSVRDPVYLCVASRVAQARLVVVDRDNAVARESELDSVAAHAAKRVYDHVASASLRYLLSYNLWRHREPRFCCPEREKKEKTRFDQIPKQLLSQKRGGLYRCPS